MIAATINKTDLIMSQTGKGKTPTYQWGNITFSAAELFAALGASKLWVSKYVEIKGKTRVDEFTLQSFDGHQQSINPQTAMEKVIAARIESGTIKPENLKRVFANSNGEAPKGLSQKQLNAILGNPAPAPKPSIMKNQWTGWAAGSAITLGLSALFWQGSYNNEAENFKPIQTVVQASADPALPKVVYEEENKAPVDEIIVTAPAKKPENSAAPPKTETAAKPARATTTVEMLRARRLVSYGDSIAFGIGLYNNNITNLGIENAGLLNHHNAALRANLNKIRKGDVVLVSLGTNDAIKIIEGKITRQEYKDQFKQRINAIIAHGGTPILLGTSSIDYKFDRNTARWNSLINHEFDQLIKDVAREMKLTYSSTDDKSRTPVERARDGLHYTRSGYASLLSNALRDGRVATQQPAGSPSHSP